MSDVTSLQALLPDGHPLSVKGREAWALNELIQAGAEGGVTIGDDTRIAPMVTMFCSEHVIDDPAKPIREQGAKVAGIHIGRDAWLGVGARIMAGVSVGDGAVIGAGAVVTKDVASLEIVGGVPAKRIGVRGSQHTLPST